MRFPSGTVPGTTASKLVVTAQVAPAAVLVAVQGTVTGNTTSVTVAASLAGPPTRSVTRTVVVASNSPV